MLQIQRKLIEETIIWRMHLKKEDNVQTPRNVTCYLEGSNATEVFCRHISGYPRKEVIWRKLAVYLYQPIWRCFFWRKTFYATYLKFLIFRSQAGKRLLWWSFLKKFSEEDFWDINSTMQRTLKPERRIFQIA